jgi:hypothetical protein
MYSSYKTVSSEKYEKTMFSQLLMPFSEWRRPITSFPVCYWRFGILFGLWPLIVRTAGRASNSTSGSVSKIIKAQKYGPLLLPRPSDNLKTEPFLHDTFIFCATTPISLARTLGEFEFTRTNQEWKVFVFYAALSFESAPSIKRSRRLAFLIWNEVRKSQNCMVIEKSLLQESCSYWTPTSEQTIST